MFEVRLIMNRKQYVYKNVIAKWIGIFVITFLQFAARKIFIIYFSDELLGLSGLLQSVIAMLGLLELGVGSAIYYSLYEPLANNDNKKTSAIMKLYGKIYNFIGLIVLIIGLFLMPFLSRFVESNLSLKTIRISYIILLTDTVLSYFLAYRRNIFNADQREYFCTNIDTVTSIFANITQILLTVLTHNYYFYLFGKIFWTILANVIIYFSSSRQYDYLKERNNYHLSDEYLKQFKNNVKTLCICNISSYLVFSTDNLLISTYINIGSVFIYSNYNIIIGTVNKIFHNIFNSTQSSVGNYVVLNDKDKTYSLFENMFFMNFFITCFTSVAMLTMFNVFIKIWLGQRYVWPLHIVSVLVLNNYLRYINQTQSVFRNAIGLYNPYKFYKFWGFVEGIVNLVVSIVLINIFEKEPILGVFLGTTVSTITVFTFSGSHALFKYYFGIDKFPNYIIKYLKYLSLTICYCFICIMLQKVFFTNIDFLNLIIASFIALIIPNVFNILIFKNTSNYTFLKSIFKNR